MLAIVKQHFREENGSSPLDFPSVEYITTKVLNLKSMAKKEGHNAMLDVHLVLMNLSSHGYAYKIFYFGR